MSKPRILVTILICMPSPIFASNPHATYLDEIHDNHGYGGGSSEDGILLFVYLLTVAVGMWLLFSYRSPINDWAENNRSWAFWAVIYVPPLILLAFK